MARGKHAASAANRKYEASIEHLDRVTNELVDAKARARQFEADHRRLPVVEAELTRQRALNEQGTADRVVELEAEIERLHELLDDRNAYLLSVKRHWERLSDMFIDDLKAKGASGIEAIESLLAVLDPEKPMTYVSTMNSKKLGTVGVQRIQRARGLRSPDPNAHSGDQAAFGPNYERGTPGLAKAYPIDDDPDESI